MQCSNTLVDRLAVRFFWYRFIFRADDARHNCCWGLANVSSSVVNLYILNSSRSVHPMSPVTYVRQRKIHSRTRMYGYTQFQASTFRYPLLVNVGTTPNPSAHKICKSSSQVCIHSSINLMHFSAAVSTIDCEYHWEIRKRDPESYWYICSYWPY